MITNSKQFPKVFYGLHMCEGVAQYSDNTGNPYRIFLNENTIRDMDSTFPGKPVYVEHVDKVNLDKIQTEADGYVVESFFNKEDGAHWVKFIAVTDEAIQAIEQKKWKLSNAYVPQEFGSAGQWHGVDYVKEVKKASYEHLAIVPNPRYAESIILTPEEFKNYCTNKKLDLDKIANSKGEKSMFNIFKRTKVEVDAEASVVLPKTGVEKTISQLINEADVEEKKEPVKEEVKEEKKDAVEPEKKEEEKEPEVMANLKHMVNVGEEKLSVEELLKKHDCMKQELEDLKKPKEEEVKEEKKDGEDPKEHEKALEEIEKLEKHEEESIAEAKKNHFETLKNAELSINKKNQVLELSCDLVERGKKLFGSN